MNKIYLLGKNIEYSLSPKIYKILGLECEIKNISSDEELENFILQKQFLGFNVTIPYKEKVIKYLDGISELVEKTKVVNTVVNKNGKLVGYNTDYFGISRAFKNVNFKEAKTIILGSGATSKTFQEYCKEKQCMPIVISRSSEINNYKNIQKHYDANIIINTTPIYGANFPNKELIDVNKFSNLNYTVDVNYLPYRTKLAISKKVKYYGGLSMLVNQAIKSYELYVSHPCEISADYIYKKILFEILNISLVGMSCVGKTTLAKEVASKLNRKHIDIDTQIEKKRATTIPKIFEREGEEKFRDYETEQLEEFGYKISQIISTGGGIVLREENRNILKSNSIIVEIRTTKQIDKFSGRPLIKNSKEYEEIKKQREKYYANIADLVVYNDSTISEVADEIVKKVRSYIDEKITCN